jgi:hypothetical protein
MRVFHFDRRRLRRTARATLMVWLFALAAGVVNACALAPAGPAQRGDTPAELAVRGPDAAAPAGHEGHDQDSGKVSCLKFCDDESSAIVKLKLLLVDFGSSLAAMAAPWNLTAASGNIGLRPSSERPGSQGPPLVIRFLRLTL